MQLVICHNSDRNISNMYLHVFRAVHWCIQVKVFDVDSHGTRAWCLYNAVDEGFGRLDGSGFGTNVIGVIDKVPSDGHA